LDRLHRADPRNARASFNMLCWCSSLADTDGCLLWWSRLIKADPAFRDTSRKHHWMNKPMSEDRDFAHLMELLKSGQTQSTSAKKE